jgi:hypothetical protein
MYEALVRHSQVGRCSGDNVNAAGETQMLQIVFVKWGQKYGPEYINGLKKSICDNTQAELKFVCITDDSSGLDGAIEIKAFPDFGFEMQALLDYGGCILKLAQFARGIIDPDLNTLYFDIDTAVFGDVDKLADCFRDTTALHALPNHFVPHWRTPWMSWITPEKCYFVNSSTLGYRARDHHDIFDDFVQALPGYIEARAAGRPLPWHTQADERFISFHEKGKLRPFPKAMAASFQDVYMTPFEKMSAWQDSFASVKERRKNRVMLTFHGEQLKPETIAKLEVGELIKAGPLVTRWNYPEFTDYWRSILVSQEWT